MARVLLHIGLPKTGTTVIQAFLDHNSSALAAHGWSYPRFIGNSNHVCVPLAFVDEDQRGRVTEYPQLESADGRAQVRSWLASELSERVAPSSRWIFSAEGFTARIRNADEIAAIQRFFSRWFDEVGVVAYFRRQEAMVVSLYSQHAREHATRVPRPLDERFVQIGDVLLDHLATYQRWVSVLGSQNVSARPYLESFKGSNNLLVDFAQVLGLPESVVENSSLPARSQNESISAVGIAVIAATAAAWRDLAAGRPPSSELDALVAEAVGPLMISNVNGTITFDRRTFTRIVAQQTPGPPLVLSEHLRQYVHDRFAASNQELARLAGMSPQWAQWLGEDPPSNGVTEPIVLSESELAAYLSDIAVAVRENQQGRSWRTMRDRLRSRFN